VSVGGYSSWEPHVVWDQAVAGLEIDIHTMAFSQRR
jgi:hypothetical protein